MSQPYDFFPPPLPDPGQSAASEAGQPLRMGQVTPPLTGFGAVPVSPFGAPLTSAWTPASPSRRPAVPGTLVGAAVLTFLQALLLAWTAAVAMLLANQVDAAFREAGLTTSGSGLGHVITVTGVVLLGLALLVTGFAVMALRRVPWAAWALVALQGFALLLVGRDVLAGTLASGELLSGLLAAAVVGLLLAPASRAWLADRG